MMTAQAFPAVAKHVHRRYGAPVAAKSATGFGHSNKLAHKRPSNTKAGVFFMPVTSRYGSCARESFGSAGCQLSQLTNLRTAVTNSFGHERGSSKPKVGASPMQSIRNLRAAAHRRMAFAALHADSSLKTRLTRYQHHINQARALEAVGGAV
jgi:hypothetical protein